MSVRRVLEKYDINNLPSFDNHKDNKYDKQDSFFLGEENSSSKKDLKKQNTGIVRNDNTQKTSLKNPLTLVREKDENENDDNFIDIK